MPERLWPTTVSIICGCCPAPSALVMNQRRHEWKVTLDMRAPVNGWHRGVGPHLKYRYEVTGHHHDDHRAMLQGGRR
jgi:hypothetical protein